jgi:hypothetical protein
MECTAEPGEVSEHRVPQWTLRVAQLCRSNLVQAGRNRAKIIYPAKEMTIMKKHRWFSFLILVLILLAGTTACKFMDTDHADVETITETFFPPQGTVIDVSLFNHEGVDYYLIVFPAGTQPDPRTSALRNAADKVGDNGKNGFIIQIRTSTVVDYVNSPENHSLAIEVIKKK